MVNSFHFPISFGKNKLFQEYLVLLSILITICSFSYRFVNDFNSMYEIIMTYHFVWSLSNIGSTLLVVHIILVSRLRLKLARKPMISIRFMTFDLHSLSQSQPNPDPIEMITPSILVTWSFVLLFFYCEAGQFVMNEFEEFAHQSYQTIAWYLFPIEMQKMLVIVMLNTQQPVVVHGLANAMCMREIFKKVKKGFF